MYPLHEAYGFEPIRNNNTVSMCGASDTIHDLEGGDTVRFERVASAANLTVTLAAREGTSYLVLVDPSSGGDEDYIVGGAGNDTIYGGAGADHQVGGASIGVVVEGSKTRNRRFGKSRSAGYGDKSRSAWDGGKERANKFEWRIAV